MPFSHIPEFVLFIINRLKAAGFPAYIVGGAVRNALIEHPIDDWDVVTSAHPTEIMELFPDIRHFALKHGTVTLVHGQRHFEITCYRGTARTIEEDLGLRDFTINAMAFDTENGVIIDPRAGRSDISRKLIRATGNPDDRFREDPLRLMRAARISAEIGFRLEQETLVSMKSFSRSLTVSAPERIREELVKIILSPAPSVGFNLLRKTGLLNHIIPELLEGYRKRQNRHHRFTIFKHIMVCVEEADLELSMRLTALLHDIAKPRVRQKYHGEWRFYGHEKASALMARTVMDRLRFDKRIQRKVTHLIEHHMIGYSREWSDRAVRRLIRRVGREDISDLIGFRRADILAHGIPGKGTRLLDELDKRVHILLNQPLPCDSLTLDGNDIMAILGLESGPWIGEIIEELKARVTEDPALNRRDILSELVRTIYLTLDSPAL